jgi:hypothetical protein
MPLRDHFSNNAEHRNWGPVHGTWPALIALELNRILPERFFAHPQIEIGAMEIDLAALEQTQGVSTAGSDGGQWQGGPVTLLEEPVVDDIFETLVYEGGRSNRLVAALEFVSPSNKDRPENRVRFIEKCVGHLKNDISVAIVDVVTKRHFNLYAELQAALGTRHTNVAEALLYAVSCRCARDSKFKRIEAWEHELSVGETLPSIPLWLSEDYHVTIDLEATYEQTCQGLRIR